MMRTRLLRTLNALMVLVLMGILAAAYSQQYFKGERPCPLCILQRVGMVGIAVGALMNLRFGIRPQHYGISLLGALFGGAVSLRQIALHVCPSFPVFGIPVWGLSLYTWAFIAFCAAIVAIVVFLLLYEESDAEALPLNGFEILAFVAATLLISVNCITTLVECGLGPCQDIPWTQP